jgi:hypothetical protein
LDIRNSDVLKVTLIKGAKTYDGVHVLSGKCTKCNTKYYADHESSKDPGVVGEKKRFYLNSAKYLKLGQSLWLDQSFSRIVINATYSFHASSAAFAEFWNDSFWSIQETSSRKLSQQQVWHAFVQESIWRVAQSSGHTLELQDGLPIDNVTKHAFLTLGEKGVVRSAENHFCSDCTHDYKHTANIITGDDSAALVGVNENCNVPVLTGDGADLAVQDAAQARLDADNAMDIDWTPSPSGATPLKLVVIDGIVMGPTHCAFDDCTQNLAKLKGGALCVHHELLYGNLSIHDIIIVH